MKTSEMKDLILDWAVATANGDTFTLAHQDWAWYSTDWAIGGPIIEREGMSLHKEDSREWRAVMWWDDENSAADIQMTGPTPLIAAMRCFVASKLGDDIEIPKEVAA